MSLFSFQFLVIKLESRREKKKKKEHEDKIFRSALCYRSR